MIVFVFSTFLGSVQGQITRKRIAPDHRFEFELIGGIKFSQIDGGLLTGFDPTGFYGGLQVNTLMSSRIRLAVGMM